MGTLRMIRRIAMVVGASALFAAAGQSVAAPLTGNVSSTGNTCLWANAGAAAVGAPCPVINVATANYFDFIAAGPPVGSPGIAGPISFGTGTVDFFPILGQTGSIFDLSIALGDIPDVLLWSVVGTNALTYQYTLQSITNIERDVALNRLGVLGLGSLCIVGDPTSCNIFTMNLTTQTVAGGVQSTTFSLTQAAVAVPEPSTLALLGLGIAGLGLIGRRRRQ